MKNLKLEPSAKYTHQVNFEKVFTTGMLKDRRYTCNYLRFTDLKSATEFIGQCDGKTEVMAVDGTGALYIKDYPTLETLE